jgi:hypothetical protein
MSVPQVQYQLSGRPTLLAGSDWAFLNGRAIITACRPVTLARFTNPLDVSDPRVVGGNLVFSMSSGRDAFLGHACVSPAAVEDHSTPEGSDECSIAIAQSRKGKLGR